MIKTGRFGEVRYDPAATTPVKVAALKQWKLSIKTDHQNVSCFGDPNKVYVPGLRDLNGSVNGFWDSTELTLFDATQVDTPGMLELVPNINEATFVFSGLAYLDADIDTNVEGAPVVSGTFMAGGPWTLPTGSLLTTSRTPGRTPPGRIAA